MLHRSGTETIQATPLDMVLRTFLQHARPPEPVKCEKTLLKKEWIGEDEKVDWEEGV